MSHVAIRPHPIFQRDGANIFMRVPLRMTQAALGGEVEVPAIDGGQGQGEDPAPAPRPATSSACAARASRCCAAPARGDMYVQVSVETPQNLTAPPARTAGGVRGGGRKADGKGSPESEGFFAKVKEFFEGGRS